MSDDPRGRPRERLADRLDGRWTAARLAVLLLAVSLAGTGVADTAVYDRPQVAPGTIEAPAAGETVIAVQGDNIGGDVNPNKPARLVGVGPRGETNWQVAQSALNVSWFYDVDPLPDGDLLVVGTVDRRTRVIRLDGDTREPEWVETLPLWDTHDVTLTAEGNLLVANMRNTNNGTSDDRVFVYNRTTDEVEWEWLFREHYPADTDEGVSAGDWTHVNDVDVIAEDLYLLSPRNFDQVIVVNRSTDEIVMRLGADGNHSVLDEQHNPSYLQTEAGAPALLVADSENDRVVEYTCDRADPDHPLDGDMEPNCDWERTWSVGGFEWPRDADRLPNGNTLVTDTINHRVVEVTPRGEVVWEYHAPWLPYDAERPVHGREAGGPTMHDLNVSGAFAVHDAGATPVDTDEESVLARLPGHGLVVDAGETVQGVLPWLRPVWMPPSAFLLFATAGLLVLGWGAVEAWLARDRLRRRLAALRGRDRATK
ncbi:aryl-sulfate sulfotransferase [Haloglomus halophilum]|uniref:aryl-sulfate sulfotransferase n=1 Tax=Haloglomus halophilum TaxID=2962672 RepID=UPI0020C966A1|nr:aryl-sulfate sulfotransferase [Haloglomus halophilum]